nr:immunoglobulin heavy chain junction region [Mus musculus]
CARGTAWFAYW